MSDPFEKTRTFLEKTMARLEQLEAQVARLQDVKQCESCLKLFDPDAYSTHKCRPAWEPGPEEGQIV